MSQQEKALWAIMSGANDVASPLPISVVFWSGWVFNAA